MNKGYTFLELICTIVIIGIVTMLVTPTMIKYIEKRKEDLYNIQIDNIELALKTWASENKESLPQDDNDTITLTLLQLKQSKILDGDIINPKTDKLIPDDMTMTITKNKKNYIYKINDDTGTVTVFDETYYRNPSILLKGDSTVYLELEQPYVDAGVIASDSRGGIIKDVKTTITGNGNSIKTNEIGKYNIKYMVEDRGLYAAINRTVIVRDTTPPELIVPGNISISKDIKEFDLMAGVSATDNSKKQVNITTKSNLSFGIPGRYTITYKAEDIYGNNVSIKRIITVNN